MEALTEQDFLKKIFDYRNNTYWKFKGELPCIIDFYADWCGPCKTLESILEEFAEKYQGRLNIYRVDTNAEEQLAGLFQIQSIPTMLFVPVKGKPQMVVGALPSKDIEKVINQVLNID